MKAGAGPHPHSLLPLQFNINRSQIVEHSLKNLESIDFHSI